MVQPPLFLAHTRADLGLGPLDAARPSPWRILFPGVRELQPTSFRLIGHSIVAILVAALGGAFVQWQYEAKLRKEQPPEGRYFSSPSLTWLSLRSNTSSNLIAQSTGMSPFRLDESLRCESVSPDASAFFAARQPSVPPLTLATSLKPIWLRNWAVRSDRKPPWQMRYKGRSCGTSLRRVARSA